MTERTSKIEQGLLHINATRFQLLCFDFLIRKYPVLKNAEKYEYGKAKGMEQTKTGVPDIYFRLSNGQYVFAECTVQKVNTFTKLKKDLESCFTTEIPSEKIDIIHLCYIGKTISPAQNKILHEISKSNGILLNIISLECFKIDLIHNFQSLAKDYLGLPVDSGQIIDDLTFCNLNTHNKFTTGLEQNFVGREKDIEEILQALALQDFIIISGKPGVGKTKIGLEACRKWCNQFREYIAKFIYPKSGNIGDELHSHFHQDSNYIILVDDAFRLENLKELFWFSKERKNKIKLILTVRDFAINKLTKTFDFLNFPIPKVFEVTPLSEDFIKSILIEKGIKNSICHSKINKIALGNPRLALMAGEVALKAGVCDALSDVSSIYDLYFEPYLKDENFSKRHLMVLGILSVFKVMDLNNNELYNNINSAFGFTKNELNDTLFQLNEKFELVEYDNLDTPSTVKIIDQTLSSYIVYQVFIKKKLLNFTQLIIYFYEKYDGRIRDAFKPIFDFYGYKNIVTLITPLINECLIPIDSKGIEFRYKFYKDFPYGIEDEIINFLNEQLNNILPEESKESHFLIKETLPIYENNFISLIKTLNQNIKQIKLGIELLLEYLRKSPSSFSEIVKFCKKEVYYHLDDYDDNYTIQINFFELLFQKIEENTDKSYIYNNLLIHISGKFLQIIAKNITDRQTFASPHYANQYISDSILLMKFRKQIWEYSFKQVLPNFKVFKQIFNEAIEINSINKIHSPLLKNEAPFVVDLMNKYLSNETFEHCKIFDEYLSYLNQCSIKTRAFSSQRKRFLTTEFKHFKILSDSYDSLHRKKSSDYSKIMDFREVYLKRKFSNKSLDDYISLIKSYNIIIQTERDFEITWSLTNLLLDSYNKSEKLFVKLLMKIFELKDSKYPPPPIIIQKLLSAFENKEEELWNIIDKSSIENKTDWQLGFLLHMPKKNISNIHFQRLLCCIKETRNWFFNDMSTLEKYEQIKPNAFIDTFELIYKRIQMGLLHFKCYNLFEKYSGKFLNDVTLLKKLYFYFNKDKIECDHDGKDFKTIYRLDKSFLSEYLKACYPYDYSLKRENHAIRDFSFLWNIQNYEEEVTRIMNFFGFHNKLQYGDDNFFKSLFKKNNQVIEEKSIPLLLKLLEDNINHQRYVYTIFNIVVEYFPNYIITFFSKFLKLNSSIELFYKLSIRPAFMIYNSRSHSPILKNQINIWENIYNLLPAKLDYSEHRKHIKKKIEDLKRDIELERKEKFWIDY